MLIQQIRLTQYDKGDGSNEEGWAVYDDEVMLWYGAALLLRVWLRGWRDIWRKKNWKKGEDELKI